MGEREKIFECQVIRAQDPDSMGRCWEAVVFLHGAERSVVLKYPMQPDDIVGKTIEVVVVNNFAEFVGVLG